MELDVCIKARRSVRAYNQEPVTKTQIETILEAGTWAPTGMQRQPWRFIIIENKELIKYVSEETKKMIRQSMPMLTKQFETEADVICYNAPVLILICAEKDPQWEQVNLLDSVLAAQNIFLKAHELKLGTCYMGFVSLLNNHPEALQKMGVPNNHTLMVPFVLGYPKAELTAGKRDKPKILKWTK